jgi:ring-1,2-phenylacetyl-CoA epoxidase subunit PaaC
LQNSKDGQIAAISEKSLKEVKYHLRWSGEWVIRLGDGTPESHERMLQAIQQLWKFTGELFVPASFEDEALRNEEGADLTALKGRWEESVRQLFEEATLPYPSGKEFELTGGKTGRHTEELGYILADMQFLQRAYPGCEW